MGPARNVAIDGVWYGPDYPEAGNPPANKVDAKFLGRKADVDDDPEPVGWAAVKTPEQAAQFAAGGAVVVDTGGGERDDVPEVDPVGSKAVESEEEAAAFRGRPTRAPHAASRPADGGDAPGPGEENKPDTPTGRTSRRASK